jgi:hypothetical protein
MFEGMTRHVGVMNNTGNKVAVVFMSLPGDEGNCLVIDTDSLPDMFQQTMRRLIDSADAQQSENLADILDRRVSPDGSNTSLLTKFHQSGRLQKVPVDLVSLTPNKGTKWPLKDVLSSIRASKNETNISDLAEMDPDEARIAQQAMSNFNPHAHNAEVMNEETRAGKARDLIAMAEMLEADAATRRQQAYQLMPDLVPKRTRKAAKPAA